MASLKDAVGDDHARIVYGIDLSRGIARIDGGTGTGATLAADSIATNAYSQTAAYVQSQWFGNNGSELYAGLRAERDTTAGSNGSGGQYSPSLGGILPLATGLQLKLNAATAFRAPTAEELFYPGYANPNLAPERTRVGDATIVDSSFLGGVSLGWFTTAGTNLIVDNANFVPENIGRASIQGLTLAAKTRPYRGFITSLAVTNVYRAQDLDTNQRIADRAPVFAATAGLRFLTPPSVYASRRERRLPDRA
jgi:outer membrane cobalamin receptor